MRQLYAVLLIVAAFSALAAQAIPQTKPQAAPDGYVWNQQPDSFRGIPWGATEKEAKKITNLGTCLSSRTKERNCSLMFKLGSVEMEAFLSFQATGFVSVSGSFDSSSYQTVKSAFIEKYGTPTTTQTKTVQNRMNAQFEQEQMEWSGSAAHIVLSRFGSKLTEGFFIIETAANYNATKRAIEAEKANLKNGL